jgi:hypothetical protein
MSPGDSGFEYITVIALFESWFELVRKRKIKETTFREYITMSPIIELSQY